MKKIILYGILASLFFSITFALNRWLNVEQFGHWFWTASLRYLFVLLILTIYIPIKYKLNTLIETIKCFFDYWYVFVFAGGLGYGLFYLLLSYAASFSPGWVLATTWQTTILFTPLVILILGNKVSMKGMMYLIIMFIGILLVNTNSFHDYSNYLFNSILPIILAAFLYPLGNTICKYSCEGRFKQFKINKYKIATNVFSQIYMMTMGAIPTLLIAGLIIQPYRPIPSQFFYTFIIAILTGVIATGFLYKARKIASSNPTALTAADGTQALESPFTFFWEYILFGAALPTTIGILGLILVILGLVFFYRVKL